MLRLLDGVPVTAVNLSTPTSSAPVHAVIDLGVRAPALIHSRTAALLGITERGPVDMRFPQSELFLPQVDSVSRELEPLEELTREHAAELESLPAAAVIGLPAFADRHLVLDLGINRLYAYQTADQLPDTAKASRLPLTAEGYAYWLTATTPEGEKLRVQFTTREYDTRVSADTAQRLGHPGGDFPKLMLGDINLMDYAVLRPSDMSGFPQPQPDITLGTDLLRHFVLIVPPAQDQVLLIPEREPHLALEERQFYVARANQDLAAVEAFLETYPDSRLALEAAETMFWLCLDQPTPDRTRIRRALNAWADAKPPHRRAMAMVQLADEMIALEDERKDALDLATLAVEVGRQFVADDVDAIAAHQLNAREGLIALLRKDYPTARRSLLSAMFGMPLDKFVNLWMGRLYEETNQPMRAWSRYIVSSMQDDPPIGALRGLDRLTEDPEFRRMFSLERAALLLEGRIPAFASPQRIDPPDAPQVYLVELFTNTFDPDTLATQLAFEALESYLAPAQPTLVEYHLRDVLADPAGQRRAAELNVQELPALYINGQGPVHVRGEEADALRSFEAAKKLIGSLPAQKPAFTFDRTARWQNDQLSLKLDVRGKHAQPVRIHALLREKLVFAPGPNRRLLHHHVVRAQLSPADGWPLTSDKSQQQFQAQISLEQIGTQREQSLAAFEQAIGGRSPVRPKFVDTRLTDVVCYAADVETGAILAIDVIPAEKVNP